MECRMKSQTQLIKEKEDELSALIEAREKISSLFHYSIKQIDGLHKKIDRKLMILPWNLEGFKPEAGLKQSENSLLQLEMK